jgi:signal transduction histidine kinase/CheY-like chemotaxis protein/HPt (histidine-containing phosphotransfer) domain-containing protein
LEIRKEDIDERIAAALMDERAEDLYEHAPCGYLSTLPNGLIVKINATMLQWMGLERQEVLLKKRLQDLLSIGGKMFYETHHAPLMQMQGFVNELSYDLTPRAGGILPVLINSVQLKDDAGMPLLNRITVFNITDRRKYELELLNAKKKAEEAARAKASFLSTVSHEFRTPMNAIIGIADLLQKTNLSDQQSHYVDILKFSSENLLNLINDILDFSKIEAGKIKLEEGPFDLRILLQNTLGSLSFKAQEKGLALSLSFEEAVPDFVYGDAGKLGQVLTNLLGNALKFTEQGTVRLQVNVLAQGGEMAELEFRVKDTGIGIAPDQHQRIFEEFTQGSQEITTKYGGTGLGLSISQRLLKLFGSRLFLKSQPGQGSEFYFTLELPLVRRETARLEAAQPLPARAGSLQGLRLLLAEDNAINIMVVAEYLTEWGVTYDVASNGKEALALVQQHTYDLVLMDLQMPLLNGYEAATAIRSLEGEQYQNLPIIAFTASARADYQERILDAGINDMIGKPFRPKDLYALLVRYGPATVLCEPAATAKGEAVATPQPPVAEDRGIETDGATISLQQYRQITRSNRQSLQKLILLTIKHFQEYKSAFDAALLSRDTNQMGELAHKIKLTLHVLEAEQISEAISSSRDLLQTATSQELRNASSSIRQALDCAIVELKMHLQKL